MEKIKELTKGKAKSLFTTSDDNKLIMHFSDDTSAFDGKKKEALLGKGAVNNQFNAFIMDHLQNNGVETHHIEVLNNNDSLVWNLNMFPIECVIRNRASGSICRRLGTEDGLILESPLFEFFLKDDELGDPLINDEHIISFGWATKDQIDEMKILTYKVNTVLKELFINSGLILVDFKVEFGVNSNGTILLSDEFTPDGCRLWDSETLKKMDKDRFRQGLGDVVESYHQVADRLGMNIIVD
jgi:phosphoribosylaminoimidazole-succinocarboxamide synthase